MDRYTKEAADYFGVRPEDVTRAQREFVQLVRPSRWEWDRADQRVLDLLRRGAL